MRGLRCLLGVAALLAGCASQPTREEPPLPFHVAVIPIAAEKAAAPATATPGSTPHEKTFELAMDSARASQTVVKTLDGKCFARATLLPYPAGVSPAEFEAKPAAERDAHWVEASKAAGADLVLECDLRYSPALKSKSNEKFWMNLPLFLLGGPACYFVDDVSYVGEARLDGNLYDLSAIVADHATLEDRRAQIVHLESRFQEATLDFIDRSNGNVGLYAASIVVPAGFLSHESAGAEAKVAGAVAGELAEGLARAVRDESREIVVADRLTGFHLDPGYRIEVRKDKVHFEGEAVIRRGEQERMESYSILVGRKRVAGEFGSGMPDRMNSTRHAKYVRFPFRRTSRSTRERTDRRRADVGGSEPGDADVHDPARRRAHDRGRGHEGVDRGRSLETRARNQGGPSSSLRRACPTARSRISIDPSADGSGQARRIRPHPGRREARPSPKTRNRARPPARGADDRHSRLECERRRRRSRCA
jgi:hypothetical protein